MSKISRNNNTHRRTSSNPANDPDFDRGDDKKSGELFNAKILDNPQQRKRKHESPTGKSQPSTSYRQQQCQIQPNSSQQQKSRSPVPQQPSRTDEAVQPTVTVNESSASGSKRVNQGFNVPDIESLVNEVQNVYSSITKLEEECLRLQNSLPEFSDTNEIWNQLFRSYERLMEKYFDFVFLSYHPSGNSVVRGLVKKYKIPLRMWNKGLFKFLDVLRPHLPNSQDMMTRFTYSCFGLLSMLTEPPYESRNMWMEALGELARFQMQLGSEFNNWRRVAHYWYIKAFTRSPGLGRIYHHCAVVCLYNVDSLFYFCKSLDATVRFDPAKETIITLFNSITDDDYQTGSAFVKLHQSLYNSACDQRYDRWRKQIRNGIQSVKDIKLRSGIIAICNIQAMLGYGINENNELSAFLKGNIGTKTHHNAKYFAFETLSWFIDGGLDDALPHVVVWLHLFYALTKEGYQFIGWEALPWKSFMGIINECLELSYQELETDMGNEYQSSNNLLDLIASWKKVLHPKYDLLASIAQEGGSNVWVPSLKQRPLPEEIALLGLSWPQTILMDRRQLSDLEFGILDEPFPGYSEHEYLPKIRPVRVVELAMRIYNCEGNNWLRIGSSGFFVGDEDDDLDEEGIDETDSAFDLNIQDDRISVNSEPPSTIDRTVMSPVPKQPPVPKCVVTSKEMWLQYDQLMSYAIDYDFIAVSKGQLVSLYSMINSDERAARAIRYIVQGLGKGSVRLFDHNGEQLDSVVDPESITGSCPPDNENVLEFYDNLSRTGDKNVFYVDPSR